MKLRYFALTAALIALGATAALLARSDTPRLTAARGLLPEVVVRAPAPNMDIDEIVVRPDHVVDAGRQTEQIN
jgi:hypothetical protein